MLWLTWEIWPYLFNLPFLFQTRMMNQKKYKPSLLKSGGVEAAPIYKSSVDCLIQTVKSEGPRALYKGFCPTWVRLGPWNIIFFMMYEQLKKVYWLLSQATVILILMPSCPRPQASIKTWLFVALASCPIGSHL